MILYLSGEENRTRPEVVLKDRANVMMTFYLVCKEGGKPDKRFGILLKHRQKTRKASNVHSRKPG